MWTDIGTPIPSFSDHLQHKFDDGFSDYMYKGRIFTVDPDYFPLDRMREIIDYLHSHQQRYGMLLFHLFNNRTDISHAVLMTNPAVLYLPNQDYPSYDRGKELDVWLKGPDGKESLGLVWPGLFCSFICVYAAL